MVNLKTISDEALAVHVRQTDAQAYREIVARYQTKLLRYANYLVGDHHLALDAVQSAFIKAYVGLNSFDPHKKFSSWLYRITHNEAINLIKKEQATIPWEEWLKTEPSASLSLESQLETKLLVSELKKHLHSLPLKYRQVLLLYYIEEKSYEEISDTLRLPVNTVGTHLRRGKKLLAKFYHQSNQNPL